MRSEERSTQLCSSSANVQGIGKAPAPWQVQVPSLKREYNVVAPARPCRTAPTAPLRPAGQRQQLLGVVVATARSAVHDEAAAVVARREEHAALSARQRRWAQHGPA